MNAPLPQSVTLQANHSVLPDSWVEKVFQKLEDFYGAKWAAQYGSFPRDRVKRTWAEELAGFADMPECIGQALKHLGQFPPTLPEFQGMCRDASRRIGDGTKSLPHKLTPDEIGRQREMSQKAAAAVKAPEFDGLMWAKRPKSQKALDMVADAKKHASRFPALAAIFDQLVDDGVASEAGKLLKRFDGVNWVAA